MTSNVLDAAYNVAHDYPGGVPALAARMDMSKNVLQKKVDPNEADHHLRLDESVKIQKFSNDKRIVKAMAQELGGVFIDLPADEVVSDMGLLDTFLKATLHDGMFANEFQRAWADGKITQDEFKRLKARIYQLIGARLAILAEIERVAV